LLHVAVRTAQLAHAWRFILRRIDGYILSTIFDLRIFGLLISIGCVVLDVISGLPSSALIEFVESLGKRDGVDFGGGVVCLSVLMRVWCLWLRVQGFEDGGVDGGDGVRLFLRSQIPGQHLRLYALQRVLNLLRLILSDLVLVLNFIAIMFILENGGDH